MKNRNSNQKSVSIPFSSLIILGRLGRGSTSHVFKTQSIRSKQLYAMKVIDKASKTYCPSSLRHQIKIHERLKHTNICSFIQHIEDNDNHYILTEYCPDGQVTKLLLEPCNQGQIIKIAHNVSMALDYLHNEAGVAHCDLKLSNILVSGKLVKLCDFGFSIKMADFEAEEDVKQKFEEQSAVINNESGLFGTLMYMSPEMLKNKQNVHHKESDIWALGICLLTLMLKSTPYSCSSSLALKDLICRGDYIVPNRANCSHYSNQLIKLVQLMLEVDYAKRITVKQILESEIFKSGLGDDRIFIVGGNRSINVGGNRSKKMSRDSNRSPICQKKCFPSQKLPKIQEQDNTIDTTQNSQTQQNFEQIQIPKSNPKIFSYSLKPQCHITDNGGLIQINTDSSIRIKVKEIAFTISPSGDNLKLQKQSSKNPKIYKYEDIYSNGKNMKKIQCLYDYARELINLIIRKQCSGQLMHKNMYFWSVKQSEKIQAVFIPDPQICVSWEKDEELTIIMRDVSVKVNMESEIMTNSNGCSEYCSVFKEGMRMLGKIQCRK